MATRTECPFYDQCGYVLWRSQRPDGHMPELPENGDCGKPVSVCGRVDPKIPHKVEVYGPITREELKAGFPLIPNQNGRPPRRLVGGGHT